MRCQLLEFNCSKWQKMLPARLAQTIYKKTYGERINQIYTFARCIFRRIMAKKMLPARLERATCRS